MQDLDHHGPVTHRERDDADEEREGTGHDPARVSDTTTEEYFANAELFAHRPTNSAMDLSKLIAAGFTPRDHREALAAYLAEMGS